MSSSGRMLTQLFAKRMTPKARATICYYAGIPLMLLAVFFGYLMSAESGPVPVALLAMTIIGFLALAFYSIATSKCPHCTRHMTLAGPGAHCPHCGEWIPFRHDQLPPNHTEAKGASNGDPETNRNREQDADGNPH